MDQPATAEPPPKLQLDPPPQSRRMRAWIPGAAIVAVLIVVGVVLGVVNRDTHQDAKPATATPTTGAGAFGQSAGAPAPLVVLAHRGDYSKFPHETTAALVAAAQEGDAGETDVYWTSDDVAILSHEGETATTGQGDKEQPMECTGGPYQIAKTRLSVLQAHCQTIASAAPDGKRYPISTLDATMKAVAAVPGAELYTEVKDENQSVAQTAQFLAIVEKYGMVRRAVITSFFPDALERVRTQAQADGVSIRLMQFVRPENGVLPTAAQLGSRHLYAVAVRHDGVSAAYVAALKAQKLLVIDWTVNTKAEWVAGKKAGVGAVLTDVPGEYRAWRG